MKHTVSKIRDERLIADYKKGDKIRLLEAYYGISKQRIYQILDDNNVKKRNLLDKKVRPIIIKPSKPKEKLYD